MRVKTLCNLVYQREIHDAGTVFEMDDVSARVQATRGTVEIIGGGAVAAVEPEINFIGGGLPSLDEEAAAKRKKK